MRQNPYGSQIIEPSATVTLAKQKNIPFHHL
jgi:hypothetical protein